MNSQSSQTEAELELALELELGPIELELAPIELELAPISDYEQPVKPDGGTTRARVLAASSRQAARTSKRANLISASAVNKTPRVSSCAGPAS